MPTLLLLLACQPAPPAPDLPTPPRVPASGLRVSRLVGGEIEIGLDARSLRYSTDGMLLDVSARGDAPGLPEGALMVAEGGGNVATVSTSELVVSGARRCRVPVRGPVAGAMTRQVSLSGTTADLDVGPAEGATYLAVGARQALLGDGLGAIVVDLERCAVVAGITTEIGKDARAAGTIDDEGIVVAVEERGGVEVRRWRLPDLVREPGFSTRPTAIAAATTGPALVIGGPSVASLSTGEQVQPLGARATVVGDHILSLSAAGALAERDGSGVVLHETAEGAIDSFKLLDAGVGELWVAGADRVAHLPQGDVESRFVSLVAPPVDSPDGQDATAAGAVARVDDPVVASSVADRCVVRRRPGGVQVTEAREAVGGVIPVWPDLARVNSDCTVLVTVDGGLLRAWRLADGEPLWRSSILRSDTLFVGPTWVATSQEGGFALHGAGDGALLGAVGPTQVWTVGTTERAFRSSEVQGSPWSAPAPRRTAYTPPRGFPQLLASAGCADPAAALAPLRPWPRFYNARLETLARTCQRSGKDKPTALPALPRTSVVDAAGSWTWPGGKDARPVGALGDGRVLVTADNQMAVLAPDGRVLWSAPGADVVAADGVVLVNRRWETSGRDAATGEVLWTRAGQLRIDDAGAWTFVALEDGPRVDLDPRTGRVTERPRMDTSGGPAGWAWGWMCRRGECFTHRTAAQVQEMTDRPGGELEFPGTTLTLENGATIEPLSAARRLPDGRILGILAWDHFALYSAEGELLRDFRGATTVVVDGDRAWVGGPSGVTASGVSPPASEATSGAPAPVVTEPLPMGPLPDRMAVTEPGGAVVLDAPTPKAAGRGPVSFEGHELKLGVTGTERALVDRAGEPYFEAPVPVRELAVVGDTLVLRDTLGNLRGVRRGREVWAVDVGGAELLDTPTRAEVRLGDTVGGFDPRTGKLVELRVAPRK